MIRYYGSSLNFRVGSKSRIFFEQVGKNIVGGNSFTSRGRFFACQNDFFDDIFAGKGRKL